MTPGAPYRWRDEAAIRAFVAEVGFGLLCVAAPDRQHVVHLPLVWRDEGHVGLHLHRANPIVRHLDGQEALYYGNNSCSEGTAYYLISNPAI